MPGLAFSLFCGLNHGLVAGTCRWQQGGFTSSKPGESISTTKSGRSWRKTCFACHGQDEAKRAEGAYVSDRRDVAVKPLKSGETAIVAGDPDSSALILRVTEGNEDALRMPPRRSGSRLSLGPRLMFSLAGLLREGRVRPHWALIAPQLTHSYPASEKKAATRLRRHRLLGPFTSRDRRTETLDPKPICFMLCCGASVWTCVVCLPTLDEVAQLSFRIRPPTPTRRPSANFSATRLSVNDGRV